MTSIKLRSKALALILTFVFAFTSVFSTGTAFAESEERPAGLQSAVVYHYDGYEAIPVDLSQMSDDNQLDIIIPSDYPGDEELSLDVYAEEGYTICSADGEEYGDYNYFYFGDLEPGGCKTITVVVKEYDSDNEFTYTFNIWATGKAMSEQAYLKEVILQYYANDYETYDVNLYFDEDEAYYTVPYYAERVSIEFVQPGDRSETVNVEFDEDNKATIEYTATSVDGTESRDYVVYVTKESGDEIELTWIDACYTASGEQGLYAIDQWDLDEYGEYDAYIPFFYDREQGITFDYGDFGGCTVTGLDGAYQATPGGTPVEFTVTSASGNVSRTFVIYLVLEDEPSAPYDVCLEYEHYEEDLYTKNVEFEGETAVVEVPYVFEDQSPMRVYGKDLNGKSFEYYVTMGDEDEVQVEHVSEYNGKTYTIKIVRAEASSDTYFWGYVMADNGSNLSEIYFDKDYIMESESSSYTITVPYGTITDADGNDDNSLKLRISLSSDYATVDIPFNEDEWTYMDDFELGDDGVYSKTFTVTAQDGSTCTATINLKEDDGTRAEADWIEIAFRDIYGDKTWYGLSVDRAATERGEVVKIPHFYDEEEGITLDVSPYRGCTVEGAQENYKLTDGKCEINFVVRSANGQVTQNYKVKVVQEKAATEPFGVRGGYYDEDGDCSMVDIEFMDNYGEFYVPESYAETEPLVVTGTDVDGKFFEGEIDIAEGEEKFVINSANGQQYTVKAVILPVSEDVSCAARIRACSSSDADYESFTVNMKEALAKGETTVTVPYGTITDTDGKDDNYIRLITYVQSDTTTVNMPRYEDMDEYREYLEPDENGKVQKVLTLTAESGKTQDYVINVVEDNGDEMEKWIDVQFEMNDDTEWAEVDFDELVKTGATTIELPYYSDVEAGFTFDVYGGNGTTVTGLDGTYQLDATGKVTIDCQITSPNGKLTQNGVITVVKAPKPEGIRYAYLSYSYANGNWGEADFEFDGSGNAQVYVPYSAKNIVLEGRDADSEYFEIPVTMSNGQGIVNLTSVTGKAYKVVVKTSDMDGDTGCNVEINSSNGVFNQWTVTDYDDGLFTATVPYGTITDADEYDDNYINAYVYLDSRTSTVNCDVSEDGDYKILLKDAGDGTYTGKFTVTAENGASKEYTVKVKEDSGDAATFSEIDLMYCLAYTDSDYMSVYLEPEDFVKNETTVTVPYCVNEFAGITMYCYGALGDVKGDQKAYYLDKDGKGTIKLQITSPNGKNTETYKIHLVKDREGNVAEPYKAEVGWTVYMEGGMPADEGIDIDLAAAATAAGADITIPADIYSIENSFVETFVKMSFNGYPTVEYTVSYPDGKSYTEHEIGNCAYAFPNMGSYDSATVKAVVTSENGKVIKTYKFNLSKEAPCVHTYGKWIIDKAAGCETAGEQHKECTKCGDVIKGVIPAKGHTSVVVPAVSATCTETGLTAGAKCSACGTVLTAQSVIPALGHDLVAHAGQAPTCTAAGWAAYDTCSRCDYSTYSAIAALGHAWETEYTVDQTATIGRAGSKSYHCEVCDTINTASVTKIVRIKKTTAATLAYNGLNRTNNVTVVDFNGKKLVKGKDFTVTYKNGKGTKVVTPKVVGSYKAVVKFKGDYSGSVTKNFKINPKATAINKLTKPAKKQIKVTWQKRTAQVTGYQVRVSLKQNMANPRTVTVVGFKKNTTTVKNLKAKKKYWVQVRTYKTVNGVKYFSAWSAKKTIVTK